MNPQAWLARHLPFLIVIGALSNPSLEAQEAERQKNGSDLPIFSARALKAHVSFLASDELRGRGGGTADEAVASAYIASQLERLGVSPVGKRTRFQDFAGPKLDGKPTKSRNVLAWIESKDEKLAKDVLVLGAHHDHLGACASGIFHGAEDNASGVAVILEVAGALQAHAALLGRSVLVVFFGCEEQFLLGSKAFVDKPPIALERIVTMVNVDMIGRPLADQKALALPKGLLKIDSRDTVGVVGAKDRPEFQALLNAAAQQAGTKVFGAANIPLVSEVIENMAKNRGDHAPFEDAGIPTLFFGSGESDDYHKLSDTADKVDGEIMARRAKLIYATMIALSRAPPEKIPRIKAGPGVGQAPR